MRPALAWCAAFLAGCAFDPAGVQTGATFDADPNAPDADPTAPDADPTRPDAGCLPSELTFDPANVDPCDLPVSMGDFDFTNAVKHQVDTQANTITSGGTLVTTLAHAVITQPGSTQEAMVILADDLSVESGAEISVIGSRPLIIVALGTLRVQGAIAANAAGAATGPGSDLLCTTGAGSPGTTQSGNQAVPLPGGSGGGGAGYGLNGGTGARVSPQGTPSPPTPGGMIWGPETVLVGGCSGGSGGVASITSGAAAGGGGGGALELVGGTEVRIDGIVSVSGGGGAGAGIGTLELGGGGGGGGSGGTLLLQSPMVKIMSGKLTSNGGGGGEGRSDGGAGMSGADGKTDDDTAALGGLGVAGGNGGNGGVTSSGAGPGTVGTGSTTATAGGGGGGGAVGRITYRATMVDVMGNTAISPNAVTLPL